MQLHIKSGRPNRWPCSLSVVGACSLSLILLVLVSGNEAIVKQPRSDDLQQQTASGQQQSSQQQQAQQQHHQSAYNNHQSPQSASSSSSAISSGGSQSPQPSSMSSSISVSSSSSASSSQQQPSVQIVNSSPSVSISGASSQQQGGRVDQLSGYGSYSGSQSSGSPKSAYLDSMSAAASNVDQQSYQAAANSVNMALANSGIYGSSSNGMQQAVGQQQGSQQQPQGAQSLNPLHYFYYPAKDSASGSAASQAKQQVSSGVDMMSNAASNNYQSLAYPSYADQLSSALSSMGAPEAAASGQDPSYLPQPGADSQGNQMQSQGSSLYSGVSNSAQQQQQQQPQQVQSVNQQQVGSHNQQTYGQDLSGYSSNMNGASVGSQAGGMVSFNGPSSSMGANSNGASGDYMNSHLGGGAGHQQAPSMGGYQGNLYQMGDLSTSNFGNNAGGLSSVASYMSPNQQHPSSSPGGSQHDLFASLAGQQSQQQSFNSAASQLSAASVPAPVSGQHGSQGSSLFNVASSLFSQQQPQASAGNTAGNLFANQQYLSSFLTPQQYSQLTGQQPGQLVGADQQMAGSQLASASASPSAVGQSGSSKRFGISSFIMPMLALAGLSLLIPTMSNIGTAVGRKKRSIGEEKANRQQQIAFDSINGASQLAKETSIGEYMDKIERYYSIYKDAVENEDCLNRLICEFGSAVKDVSGKSAVVMVIEKLAPTWMTGKVHLFRDAALDNKEGKEKCKKYVCHSNKHH